MAMIVLLSYIGIYLCFHLPILKSGGVYVLSNIRGCDGERTYYDGCCMIAVNGDIVSQGSQFSIADVEVTTAAVDLENVRAYRNSFRSRTNLAADTEKAFPRVTVDFALTTDDPFLHETKKVLWQYHSAEEEIA